MQSTIVLIALFPLLAQAAPQPQGWWRTRTKTHWSADPTSTEVAPASTVKAPNPSESFAIPPSNPGSTPVSSDCSCGYVLSQHGDAYFPLAHRTDFGTLPSGKLTADQLRALGWEVSQGWQAGAIGPENTVPMGDISTFSAKDSALHMTVPGGYGLGGEIPSSEITFVTDNGITGGVFTMEAVLSDIEGTCQSIFTYKKGDNVRDEQDIEILGQSINKPMANGTPAGIQLTNWDPNNTEKNDNTVVPFPADPTAGFHNYTIAWLPDSTKYYFDDAALKGPSQYPSVNPSELIINHWSSGVVGWTEGPPTQDVTMKVKSATLYYKTPGTSGLPEGCSKEKACRI